MALRLAVLRAVTHPELASIIARDAESLTELWMSRAHYELSIRSTHRNDLRDHLPSFLTALAECLGGSQEASEALHGFWAAEHGKQRWSIGWRVEDVVADFQLLRVVLCDHLEQELERELTQAEMTSLNLLLDDAIQQGVRSFAKHNDEALQMSQQRMNEFLGVFGHELRNPLSAVAMAMEVLKFSGSSEQQETIDIIDDQIALMTRLMDDLLDISRITRGDIELRRNVMDLRSAVEGATEAIHSAIDRKRQTLHLALPEHEVLVDADGERLHQLVTNLLTNASKYTAAGESMTVSLEEDGGFAVLTVRDRGIGIKAELLPFVFDLFVQDSENRRLGQGIGLALVKSLVELHGGDVAAKSPGAGQGSEFIVRLPLCGPQPASGSSLPHPEAEVGALRRRILVVDDNRDAAEMLAMLLQRMGHETRTAHDGEEAVCLAAEYQPSLVLLDLELPKLNGFQVAQQLLSVDEWRRPVLIALTGYAQDSHRFQSQAAGFDCHLVKPVDMQELQRVIARHLPAGDSQ